MEKVSLEIVELGEQRISFAINCDVSLANALRRIIISEVPTLATHLVTVLENSSVLHDEFLCQRLALIPFASDMVDQIKYPWECSCSEEGIESCQDCKSYFVLEVKNTSQEILEVTSMDIRPLLPLLKSDDEEIRPIMPVHYYSSAKKGQQVGIPIVKLAKNQEIKVRLEVQKGTGKMHAKWSPVSLAAFHEDPDIRLDQTIELNPAQKQLIQKSCPRSVFELHDHTLEVANPSSCIFCGECKKTAETMGQLGVNLIRIGRKKNRFIFDVESVLSLSPIAIVRKALGVLREKMKQLEESIK